MTRTIALPTSSPDGFTEDDIARLCRAFEPELACETSDNPIDRVYAFTQGGKTVEFRWPRHAREELWKESARVRYDGKLLKFPEHVETKPLEQAARQARWLAEFLTGATGHPVRVVPVLALPGWYVELTAPISTSSNDVRVINPKAASFMRTVNFGPRLEDDQRRRIAWTLTKRYGDTAQD